MEDAADAANEMCYLLALTKIIDPLVEVDNAGKLVSLQIKVCFEKNTKASQVMAKNWVQGVLRYNLRSFQLGFRIMSISSKYARQVLKFPH